jgi:hypothetical protein
MAHLAAARNNDERALIFKVILRQLILVLYNSSMRCKRQTSAGHLSSSNSRAISRGRARATRKWFVATRDRATTLASKY